MPKYKVLEPLNHDQKQFGAGDVIEMSAEQAAPLQAVSVLSEQIKEKAEK